MIVVDGDGIEYLAGLIELIGEIGIVISDLFIFLLKFIDFIGEYLLIGIVFYELFPELGCGFYGGEEEIHVFVVLGLEL